MPSTVKMLYIYYFFPALNPSEEKGTTINHILLVKELKYKEVKKLSWSLTVMKVIKKKKKVKEHPLS